MKIEILQSTAGGRGEVFRGVNLKISSFLKAANLLLLLLNMRLFVLWNMLIDSSELPDTQWVLNKITCVSSLPSKPLIKI